MARVPLLAPDDMDSEQREQYDRFPSNLTRALLLADSRLARALPETANALRASQLDPRTREGVILRVAALRHSAYERMQHLEQASTVGWSEGQITAIEQGNRSALPPDFAIVLDVVDELVGAGDLTDATFAAARAALSDRDLVTTVLLVGHYLSVARLLTVLRIELDDAPDPWTAEH